MTEKRSCYVKKILIPVSLLTLGLGPIACEKLDQVTPGKGALPFEQTKVLDAMPLEYGELVAITSDSPHRTVVWFEKPDKTIVAVQVNHSRGIIHPNVLTIPRK